MTPGYDDLIALYQGEAMPLLVYIERRVDDPELATDLLSETFTRALEQRESFRGSTAAELSAWVWSIARSTLSEHQRRIAVEGRGTDRLGRARRALTGDELDRIEELAGREHLRAAAARELSRLPADQREAVRLRIVEDRSYREIARELGVSDGGARTRVWRGLRRLTALLELEWEARDE